jgi:hypothetical protein
LSGDCDDGVTAGTMAATGAGHSVVLRNK